ncbi:hypothetical protein FRC11_010732, partial [Ceratobasidium sp. 423]
ITSTSQSLATLTTLPVTAETRSQIAIKTVSIITLSLAKNVSGQLEDLVVNLEKCVPGVDKEIYRIMTVETVAKLRASGSSGASVLNQAELKLVNVNVGI